MFGALQQWHHSWGRREASREWTILPAAAGEVPRIVAAARDSGQSGLLATGLRRSYGDSCLNPGGLVLDMTGPDNFVSADWNTGVVEAEAGLSLDRLIAVAVPKGFFVPVVPGTRHVTLGGAIASDVHGKNHHVAGSFGHHVTGLDLVRPDGQVVSLTPQDPLFRATVGGLGLTGVILRARLALVPAGSAWLDAGTVPFAGLDTLLDLFREYHDWPYSVAWLDMCGTGGVIRGLFSRGRFRNDGRLVPHAPGDRITVPGLCPDWLLCTPVIRLFNALYHAAGRRGRAAWHQVHYAPFFWPLDAIGGWNRLYGRRGFFQYQCVLPPGVALEAARGIADRMSAAGLGAFLAVAKLFGDRAPAGLLSFPRPGLTLALDFPDRGEATARLLGRLDDIVREAGGALYPAKDARMDPGMFRAGFPRLADFLPHTDPLFSSGLSRRTGISGDGP